MKFMLLMWQNAETCDYNSKLPYSLSVAWTLNWKTDDHSKAQSSAYLLSVRAVRVPWFWTSFLSSGVVHREVFDPGRLGHRCSTYDQMIYCPLRTAKVPAFSASLLCRSETSIYDSEMKFNVRLQSVPGRDLGSENETLMCFCPNWSSSTSWSRSWTMASFWALGTLITVWFIFSFLFS